MKIALIGNDYVQQFPLIGYGGIESCVENLAYGLHHLGADFFCIVPKRDKGLWGTRKLPSYSFPIFEASFNPSSGSKRSAKQFAELAAKIVKTEKPDIIWSQSYWSIEPMLSLDTPILCTFHDSCVKQSKWMVNHKNVFYRFISQFQFQEWVRKDWEYEKSVQVYTGLSDEEFDFGNEREDYFLWVAGLNWGWKNKGLDIFLKLAEENPNKKFLAYGSGNKEIELELKRKEKLLRNFLYGGELHRGDLHHKAFKRAKAFLMPTQIPETLGRTVIESLSKGTPVIGSKNGAIPEVIGEYGVATNNFMAMNQALNQSFDFEKCFEYSKKFSVNIELKKMMEISSRILNAKSILD